MGLVVKCASETFPGSHAESVRPREPPAHHLATGKFEKTTPILFQLGHLLLWTVMTAFPQPLLATAAGFPPNAYEALRKSEKALTPCDILIS